MYQLIHKQSRMPWQMSPRLYLKLFCGDCLGGSVLDWHEEMATVLADDTVVWPVPALTVVSETYLDIWFLHTGVDVLSWLTFAWSMQPLVRMFALAIAGGFVDGVVLITDDADDVAVLMDWGLKAELVAVSALCRLDGLGCLYMPWLYFRLCVLAAGWPASLLLDHWCVKLAAPWGITWPLMVLIPGLCGQTEPKEFLCALPAALVATVTLPAALVATVTLPEWWKPVFALVKFAAMFSVFPPGLSTGSFLSASAPEMIQRGHTIYQVSIIINSDVRASASYTQLWTMWLDMSRITTEILSHAIPLCADRVCLWWRLSHC